MKAIVVVFFRKRRPETFRQRLKSPRTVMLEDAANANGKTPVLPFWTWFIENPRSSREVFG